MRIAEEGDLKDGRTDHASEAQRRGPDSNVTVCRLDERRFINKIKPVIELPFCVASGRNLQYSLFLRTSKVP